MNLHEMRLPVMADQLRMMSESNELSSMDTMEVLQRMTENELISRKNNTANRSRKNARLSQPLAAIDEIDYKPERKINASVIKQLKTNEYIRKHRNVIILGACGSGKSYIGNALCNNACDELYKVFYRRMFEFISDLNQARLIGNETKILKKYSRMDVLIIDDFLLNGLNEQETMDVFKVMEMRYGHRSTVICSQLEPSEWHQKLGSGQLADSILDRIIPNSYELVLYGDSLRKEKEK